MQPGDMGKGFMSRSYGELEDAQTRAIIGAALEVHRQLGPGFLEAVYDEAMAVELADRGIPFQRQTELTVSYKGRSLGCTYKPDFICYQAIIVELKALAALGGLEQAQVINYLKASGMRRGLLLNFGAARLEIKRLVFHPKRAPAAPPCDPTDDTTT